MFNLKAIYFCFSLSDKTADKFSIKSSFLTTDICTVCFPYHFTTLNITSAH